MISAMFHPWRTLRDLTDWILTFDHTLASRGECSWSTKTIRLRAGLTQAQRRCVLAHELEHAARGPFPRWATVREEDAVNAAAARKLINIRALGEALAWSQCLDEIAEELWVDVPTLTARLSHLHPAERAYLAQRLETP